MGKKRLLECKVAPTALYYLAIDGTGARDSVAFARLLEKHRGWRNLARDFLRPAPDDATRLADPAHPFLPVPISQGIPIVAPSGRDGQGLDPFWADYSGDTLPDGNPYKTGPHGTITWPERPDPTTRRATAAEQSNAYMAQLLLNPTVVGKKDGDALKFEFLDTAFPRDGATRATADLLYVSSHGWLGGYMQGNQELRSTPTEPSRFIWNHWFLVGRAAAQNRAFHGPLWVILAQCSTLNTATWPLWSRLLAKSSPIVRGILAYADAAPAEEQAAGIAESFFRSLDAGESFVRSWAAANDSQGRVWAAIVHKDAVEDRLPDWRCWKPPASAQTGAAKGEGNYVGYLRDLGKPEEILDVPPPFEIEFESFYKGENQGQVRPETLDMPQSRYWPEITYRLTIQAPTSEKIQAATIWFVHIRRTFTNQFSIPELFPQHLAHGVYDDASLPCTLAGASAGGLRIDPGIPVPANALAIELKAGDEEQLSRLRLQGLHPHHSYLWPRITIQTTRETLTYDFTTHGLTFIG